MVKKQFSAIGFGLALIMILGQLVGPILESSFPTIFSGVIGTMVASYIGIYVFGVGLLLVITRKMTKAKINEKNTISIKKLILLFIFGYGTSSFVTLAYNYLFKLLGANDGNAVGAAVVQMDLVQNLLVVVCIGPILEELLYRGLLYKLIAPIGKYQYIVFSSVAFGLFHGNISQIIYASILGAILGYIMWETKNIMYTILFHILNNFIGGFLPLVLGDGKLGYIVIYSLMAISIAATVLMVLFVLKKGAVRKTIMQMKKVSFKPLFINFGTLTYIIICSLLAIATIAMQLLV
ncbi:hypothetical protein BAU15_08255 [Enterococcus sp. JM4C]|uniref:CPBP family intramembrane glutamic endopeptidase n=1 Tax=Candidatus Enterococcus huntleyi TaxID=1857217 RepID=UPI00137A04A2|nr:type II CAAX endopeptidase family protein [Enterococcus sp. JM4C]KAF1297887.1 hypothetical protein BAU15_08255 [Enterococcus sp. JM4C]